MKLWWKKKEQTDVIAGATNGVTIDKNRFIETIDPMPPGSRVKGIDVIFDYLEVDYEQKGYNDAIINPDMSNRDDGVKLLKSNLQIIIQRVNTYYTDLIFTLDFHISTRTNAGLIDLVKNLELQKSRIQGHLDEIMKIQDAINNETGVVRGIILSYQRGFMHGLSDLTQTNVTQNIS
jgi:hypothetical protein